jgi:hypothetical protein
MPSHPSSAIGLSIGRNEDGSGTRVIILDGPEDELPRSAVCTIRVA